MTLRERVQELKDDVSRIVDALKKAGIKIPDEIAKEGGEKEISPFVLPEIRQLFHRICDVIEEELQLPYSRLLREKIDSLLK